MNIAETISLLTKVYATDSIGQQIPTVTKTDVIALVESASQSEYFNAGQMGLKPEFKFTVILTEYEGQEDIEYRGEIYSIYRTYRRNDGRIELYTQKKVGDD